MWLHQESRRQTLERLEGEVQTFKNILNQKKKKIDILKVSMFHGNKSTYRTFSFNYWMQAPAFDSGKNSPPIWFTLLCSTPHKKIVLEGLYFPGSGAHRGAIPGCIPVQVCPLTFTQTFLYTAFTKQVLESFHSTGLRHLHCTGTD